MKLQKYDLMSKRLDSLMRSPKNMIFKNLPNDIHCIIFQYCQIADVKSYIIPSENNGPYIFPEYKPSVIVLSEPFYRPNIRYFLINRRTYNLRKLLLTRYTSNKIIPLHKHIIPHLLYHHFSYLLSFNEKCVILFVANKTRKLMYLSCHDNNERKSLYNFCVTRRLICETIIENHNDEFINNYCIDCNQLKMTENCCLNIGESTNNPENNLQSNLYIMNTCNQRYNTSIHKSNIKLKITKHRVKSIKLKITEQPVKLKHT